jgi:hypothetical protein
MKKLIMLLLFCTSGKALLSAEAAPQAQQPSVVEQNRVVPPKDAINGADWLKAQGVQQGLAQLDLGADAKGRPIKFQMTGNGGGVQLKLTGSALDNALAGDKTGGGIMGKFRKKDDAGRGASGLTVTDLLGPHFAPYDPENKGSSEAESASRTLGKLAKLNQLAGGGRDHYLMGSNLYPSDLRMIEQNAPVLKLLAEGKPDEANKLYSSLHAGDAGADLGTSDPAKLALIQSINATMDQLTAQEQPGAGTLHFKAEGGDIVAHLDEQQTANIDKVLESMSTEAFFGSGRITYRKDAGRRGLVAIDSGISSTDASTAAAPLKIAIDSGDAAKVKAYQKYKGLNEAGLPKR